MASILDFLTGRFSQSRWVPLHEAPEGTTLIIRYYCDDSMSVVYAVDSKYIDMFDTVHLSSGLDWEDYGDEPLAMPLSVFNGAVDL